MNYFVILLLVAVTCSGFAVDKGWLPGAFRLLPEALSVLVLLVVLAEGLRDRFRHVRPEYWFAFGGVVLLMVCGVLANGVEPGPVISGLRTYMRALPLFLLPAVIVFTERQLRLQLLALLVIVLAQLPLSIQQKQHEMFYGNSSGDNIVGTLGGSGLLSIFLIGAACVLTAMYVQRRLSLWAWLALLAVCLGPIAINETKASFILLPIGLLVTFWVASPPRRRAANLLGAVATLVAVGAAIIPIYDYWADQRPQSTGGGVSVIDFFTDQNVLDSYVNFDPGKDTELLGRGVAYRVAATDILHDPVKAVLGLGIGNASRSNLGFKYSGQYAEQYWPVRQTSVLLLLLELGAGGLLLTLLGQWLVYRDALVLARADASLWGSLAAGWAGAMAATLVASLYAELLQSAAISYPFWYLSGLVAARRMRVSGANP